MNRSGNWKAIERLPEAPGVVKMTGNGYWLDGRFYPSRRTRDAAIEPPRRGWLALFGR